MNKVSIIKKYVIPPLEAHGYQLEYSDRMCHVFWNKEHTVSMSFTYTNRWPPDQIKEHLLYLNDRNRYSSLKPKFVLISFGVNATRKERNFPVDLFNSNTPLISNGLYYNEETFLSVMLQMVQQSLDIVLPYLESVASQAVFISDAPYHLLSDCPKQRGERFAQKHSLPLSGDGEDLYNEVTQVFLKLLPTEFELRKMTFQSKAEEIADFTAYCGETLLSLHPGKWGPLSPLPISKEIQRFGIILDNVQMMNDLMWHIVESWNFTPQVNKIGIFGRGFYQLYGIQEKTPFSYF